MAPIPAPALTLRGLTRSFGETLALPPVDLTLGPGERIALRGPNGSGKTTLLRCVAGTLTPSAGEARVGPHRAGTRPAQLIVGASLASERSFYLRLTGRANLQFFARLRNDSEHAALRQVEAIVDELEIDDIVRRRRLDGCSTGMLQQVALARALLGRPRRPDDNCLERSVLAYRFLAEAGAEPQLACGIRRVNGELVGHAWIVLDGRPLAAADEAVEGYTLVAAFGAGGARLSAVFQPSQIL